MLAKDLLFNSTTTMYLRRHTTTTYYRELPVPRDDGGERVRGIRLSLM